MHYSELVRQLDECKRLKSATQWTAKRSSQEVHALRAEAKKAKAQVVTLTKKEHAKSKEKSSAAYASTAATILIIFYQVVEVAGGWGRWEPVFQHEATIGVMQVAIGSMIAWAMRPLQH